MTKVSLGLAYLFVIGIDKEDIKKESNNEDSFVSAEEKQPLSMRRWPKVQRTYVNSSLLQLDESYTDGAIFSEEEEERITRISER